MSLISQNLPSKKRAVEFKIEEDEELMLAQGDEEREPENMSNLGSLKKKKKKKKKTKTNDASSDEKEPDIEEEKEMKRLEDILFGSLYSPVEFGKETDEDTGDGSGKGMALFFTDRSGTGDGVFYEEDMDFCVQREEDEVCETQKQPAWIDDEEERVNVDITRVNRLRKLRKEADESLISGKDYVSRLRSQHIKLNPGTEWAQIGSKSKNHDSYDESDEEDGVEVTRGYGDIGDDDILKTNEDLIVKSDVKLLPGILEYSRLVDANKEDPSNAPINSVGFHRNAQLLFTAGLDRRLRFFQIDGKRNTKIQSVFIEDCPIRKASFLPDGSQVVLAGRRKFFYCFDLVNAKVDKVGPLTGREEKSLETFEVSPDSSTIAFVGNEGYILLVSSRTKDLIGTLKMNGTARSLAFANGGEQLLSSGGDGHVYHWDLRTRRCFHKGIDEGCLTGSALCTSPDSSLFAAGSSSGIVNVYNREEFLGGKRKPLKVITNLTTAVDGLQFNNDAQMLAICSSMKKNSLKLVHIPSFTVFSNWPGPKCHLQYARCMDFSPGGGFMAIGNAAGKAFLYKLHHYQHA